MEPIHIDLRNLSQEHLAQCKPHMGGCCYDDPCIIGTLLSPDDRHALQTSRGDEASVQEFLESGKLVMPEYQWEDAQALQQYFDCEFWDSVLEITNKYIGAQGMEAEGGDEDSVHDSPVAESDAPKVIHE